MASTGSAPALARALRTARVTWGALASFAPYTARTLAGLLRWRAPLREPGDVYGRLQERDAQKALADLAAALQAHATSGAGTTFAGSGAEPESSLDAKRRRRSWRSLIR